VLGLGGWARMNDPARHDGNWKWRLREGALSGDVADRVRGLVEIYGRR